MKTRHLLVLALVGTSVAPAAAQPSRDAELHAFLQERFAEDRAAFPGTRYVHGWADLNDDGRPEALVYLISGNYCGSGGCRLFLYTPEQGSWYQKGALTVTNPPVMVLNTRSNGWRDLAVRVSGGGARLHMALVPHGEWTYAPNPSVAPARRLPRGQAGRTIIEAGDRGRPLF